MSAARAHGPAPRGGPDPSSDGSDADQIVVTTLRWPEESDARQDLAAAGLPRILLVAEGEAPPITWDEHEDWIRAGATAIETEARAGRLARRASSPGPPVLPVLDADGVLHASGGRLVVVPPKEAAMLAQLLTRAGCVVRRDDLRRAGWPSGSPDHRAVDGRVRSLRRRIRGMGVAIHTVRGIGYLLDPDEG